MLRIRPQKPCQGVDELLATFQALRFNCDNERVQVVKILIDVLVALDIVGLGRDEGVAGSLKCKMGGRIPDRHPSQDDGDQQGRPGEGDRQADECPHAALSRILQPGVCFSSLGGCDYGQGYFSVNVLRDTTYWTRLLHGRFPSPGQCSTPFPCPYPTQFLCSSLGNLRRCHDPPSNS